MTTGKLIAVVLQNVRRNRKNFVFSSFGITVGVCVFSFFVALTFGIREEVLNRMYPVDLIEVEPSSVNIAGARSNVEKIGFNAEGVEILSALEGIGAVFPKLKSRLQATYKIGGQIFGKNGVTFEAYFDGLDDTLLRSELEKREAGQSRKSERDRLKEKYGRKHRCYDHRDCTPGEECREGYCEEIDYWTLFRDHGEFLPCSSDKVCAAEYGCIAQQCRRLCDSTPGCLAGEECRSITCRGDSECGEGTCKDGVCSKGACFALCAGAEGCVAGLECIQEGCREDADCLDGTCVEGRCSLAGTCGYMHCVQTALEKEINTSPDLRRGELPGLCEDGTEVPEEGECAPARCPVGSYCSVHTYHRPGRLWRDKRGEGRCEQPIPVVLNPIVLEIFNLVLGSTLDKTQLGTLDTLLGYGGTVTFGHSFYKETVKDRTPVLKKMTVVGFSNKALEAGVTMPMEYVKRANARYKGKRAAEQFDSIILQLSAAEHLPEVMNKMEHFNIQLSRRSAEAEKFRIVLIVAIAIFFIMASIILGIAAPNITHTFHMVIYERKREIGIIRALGATKMDIRFIFLVESLLIGLAGGLAGNGLAYGLSKVADHLANRYIGDFPFQPETFFHFHYNWVAASFAFAVFFSLMGAFFPANRAASMDPARTLTLP